MTASAIVATTTLAAGRYLAASRERLQPELVALAGAEFCREHHLVPLRREGDAVLVAATQPADAETLAELRERLARPLLVRAASPGEVRVAIAIAEGRVTSADWRRALADVLQSLQLLRPEHAGAYVLAADDEAYLGAALVEASMLSDEERIEGVGLAFHLPHVDLVTHPPRADLDALFDIGTLRELRALPLWAVGEDLYVAFADPPSADLVSRIESLVELHVRPVLAAPAVLDARLASLEEDQPATTHEVGTAVREANLISATQLDAAMRVAAQRRQPLTEALTSLFGISTEQVQAALARQRGIGMLESARSVEPEVAALVPPALARRLRAVPVALDGDRVRVAMADPRDRRALRALAALLERDVQPLAASEARVTEIIETNAGAARRAELTESQRTLRLMSAAGYVAVEIGHSERDPHGATARLARQLWDALSEQARAELFALGANGPLVERLLLNPAPQAIRLGSQDAGVLPLLLDDGALTIAAADHGAALAASREHSIVRIAAARPTALRWARELLGGLDLAALTPGQVALGRVLQLQRGTPRADVLALVRRMQELGEPLDVAATRLELIAADELAELVASLLGTEAVRLERTDRMETTVGAQGVAVTRRYLDEPVDHTLARLLSVEEAERLGALPFGQARGRLLVAAADPLDPAVRAELELRFGRVELRPTTRGDVREGSLRAHGRPTIGDLLLEAGLVTRGQLRTALALAERSGVRIGEALVSMGVLAEEEFAAQMARQHQLPFIALRGLELDAEVTQLLPEPFVRAHRIVPVVIDDAGRVTLAVEDPAAAEPMAQAAALVGREVTYAVTTRADVRDALERLYHRAYLEHSAADLLQRFPGDSAYQVLSRGQKWFLLGLAGVIAASVALWTVPTLIVLLALSTGFYLAFSGYKFYLIYRALSHTLEVPVTQDLVDALEDRNLPVYTLLIPLYRESAVLPMLVRGLSRLDYPKEKLDVKLLLEEDDGETIAAARAANLPPYFDITIVPDGQPKGKPKACNYGLLHARGEYVVIYDAEDIPEPDQLKKVLVAFSISEPNVVCIQTKLNYYNRNQNVLTKWFTTEYSTWFDLFLPGLDASGAPIPLGGTSNHFRTEGLRLAGAWDPFNVTEDADLGLRIFKLGGRTAVVDSTTFEEANSVLDNWIRQRSRWVKGYIQTYLVHMRHPWRLMRSLGLGGFLSFQLVIGGTFFGFLLNPVLWTLTGVWFATQWSLVQQIFPGPVYYMGAISLYAGNFAFAYMNVAGCLRRRYYSLVKWALLSPVYWVLMSIAAWKGFLQLFYRPFYWEKTVHGLASPSHMDDIADLTAGGST